VKLSIAENVSKMISNLVATLVASLVFFFFLLFASIAGAIGLGQLLNNGWLGFLIVAGFYLIAGIIIWKLKEKLLRIPIMNSMIAKFFDNLSEDEKD
jgi:ABC-type multidrug transport system fused ATPase/permease subunit